MEMKKIFLILFIVFALVFAGCTQAIKDIKKEEMKGKTVTVEGMVKNTIKLGKISGYTIVDQNKDEIGVASQKLPLEGEKITISGILIKDTLLGYYIKIEE